jgi:hypothetical protein
MESKYLVGDAICPKCKQHLLCLGNCDNDKDDYYTFKCDNPECEIKYIKEQDLISVSK